MDHAEALERIEIAAAEPDGLERLMAGDTPDVGRGRRAPRGLPGVRRASWRGSGARATLAREVIAEPAGPRAARADARVRARGGAGSIRRGATEAGSGRRRRGTALAGGLAAAPAHPAGARPGGPGSPRGARRGAVLVVGLGFAAPRSAAPAATGQGARSRSSRRDGGDPAPRGPARRAAGRAHRDGGRRRAAGTCCSRRRAASWS